MRVHFRGFRISPWMDDIAVLEQLVELPFALAAAVGDDLLYVEWREFEASLEEPLGRLA